MTLHFYLPIQLFWRLRCRFLSGIETLLLLLLFSFRDWFWLPFRLPREAPCLDRKAETETEQKMDTDMKMYFRFKNKQTLIGLLLKMITPSIMRCVNIKQCFELAFNWNISKVNICSQFAVNEIRLMSKRKKNKNFSAVFFNIIIIQLRTTANWKITLLHKPLNRYHVL